MFVLNMCPRSLVCFFKHAAAQTLLSVLLLLWVVSWLLRTEKLPSMSFCRAFRASWLISTGAECCFPGSSGSILPEKGGGGTENFLAMLCRTQHVFMMLDFLSKESSCANPSCLRHLKRLFIQSSAVCMTLWIFA